MNPIKVSLIIFSLTCSQWTVASEITLKNGDTIHGEIIKDEAGQMILLHPILGTLTISKAQIKVPEATKEKPKDPGLFRTGFLKNWERNVDVGVNGSEGNSRNINLHAGTRLKFKNKLRRWDIEAAYNSSEDGGVKSRNQFFARFNRDFLIHSSTHFYFTQGRYDWDEFENWDYRLSFGGGAGSQLIGQGNWIVDGRIGLGVKKEFGGKNDTWVPEGILGLDSNWDIAERHSLEFKNRLYPSLREFGEFRNITALNWKIGLDQLNGIALKVGIQNEFDSNAASGSKKNDFKYTLSLNFGI